MSFLSLNLLVQLHVLQYIPLDELYHNVAMSCKSFAEICRHSYLWRGKFFIRTSRFDSENALLCSSAILSRNSKSDQLIVYGGNVSEGNLIRDVREWLWCYDLGNKKWEKSRLTPLTEHSSVVYKNFMYVFGGNGGLACNYTSQLMRYPLPYSTKSQFEPIMLSNVPQPRSGHSAILYQDSMYVFGGWDGKVSFGDLHRFDFRTSTWSMIPPRGDVPCPRRTHSAFLYQDYMYIFGGFDDAYPASSFNSVYRFDIAAQRWSVLPCSGEIPSGRSRCGFFVWRHFLYIMGGWDRVNHFRDMYRLNMESHVWEEVDSDLDSIVSGIAQHCCVMVGDWLHVIGGRIVETGATKIAPSDRILVMRLGVTNPETYAPPQLAC